MGAPANEIDQRIVLARHGETEWSRDGRHTGRTDLPLTEPGVRQGEALRPCLGSWTFARVLTSPLQRARETCRLAGLGDRAEIVADLHEWDYGDYEGRTTADIRTERPGWFLWDDGCPGGETADDVGRRADRVVASLRSVSGDVAVFGHGHMLRVLAARWVGLPPDLGRSLVLSTGTLSILGYERAVPALVRWNAPCS
jgi:broad specificity phosphatase PhoE